MTAPVKLNRIHHVAYRCKDAKATADWYAHVLGMEFTTAFAEDHVPSTGEYDPYMHIFLDCGGGNVIAFDLGDRASAWRFLDALQIVDISNNLGDAKSMATHPCTTTHRSMPEAERLEIGLTEGWVRMSVGLEGPGDLVRDVSRALDGA